ncbi:hypothetical protein WJX81_005325 [Elliptochloris bilobata]|uniref:Peptidase M48 domain-containing protein n=1 Tax=Elliptochloris bilobata TaxID=381761 RepID=A0AAW1SCR6_9CHLO
MAVLAVDGGVVLYIRSRQVVLYTHRIHTVSTETEKRMGDTMFKQVEADALRQGTLLPSAHPAALLVKKNLDWGYAVIKIEVMNAAVLPGGKILVSTGLLSLIDHKDELAAVLGHEAGHVVARHSVRSPA